MRFRLSSVVTPVTLLALVVVAVGGSSRVSLAEDDPFGGAGDAGMQVPDGSSSIRARKKICDECLEGQVIKRTPRKFPEVILKVKVRTEPADRRYAAAKAGSEVEIVPVFKGEWSQEANHTNIGAWFVEPKDGVRCKIAGFADGRYQCEALTRVRTEDLDPEPAAGGADKSKGKAKPDPKGAKVAPKADPKPGPAGGGKAPKEKDGKPAHR